MKPCIYKITSPSGRIYIGQTINFKQRRYQYNGNSCKKQHRLYASFQKYGINAHEFKIVVFCKFEQLNILERLLQDRYNCTGIRGLNITLTQTHLLPIVRSEETKLKYSLSKIGSKNPMYGRFNNTPNRKNQLHAVSGANSYLSKYILNTETGIYYDCLQDAADSCNMLKGSLWAKMVKNKYKKSPFIYAL